MDERIRQCLDLDGWQLVEPVVEMTPIMVEHAKHRVIWASRVEDLDSIYVELRSFHKDMDIILSYHLQKCEWEVYKLYYDMAKGFLARLHKTHTKDMEFIAGDLQCILYKFKEIQKRV